MNVDRGDVDVETLLKIVLVLLVIVLAIEVASRVVGAAFSILRPLVVIAIVVLIALWLLDRL